jgi:hypothetical protein
LHEKGASSSGIATTFKGYMLKMLLMMEAFWTEQKTSSHPVLPTIAASSQQQIQMFDLQQFQLVGLQCGSTIS